MAKKFKIDKGVALGGIGLILMGLQYIVNIKSSNHQTKMLKDEIISDVLNKVNNQ